MSEGSFAQVLDGSASWSIAHGDSFFRLLDLPPNSVDSMVADPPAGIGFMNREWDRDKGGMREWIGWLACIMERSLRAMKPGAHGFVWALPRTSHWTGMALEYAGFEIRGQIQHWFGSGFPKSLNLRDEWAGWGTALKPANEVWWIVRKPLERGLTVAENVAKWGTGALNVDACRVASGSEYQIKCEQSAGPRGPREFTTLNGGMRENDRYDSHHNDGRWPPDVLLTHDARCRKAGAVEVPAHPTWDTPSRETKSTFTGSEVSKVRHANGRNGEASADKRYADQGSTSFAPLPGTRRDDTETVDRWECVEGCPVACLAAQSGESRSVVAPRGGTSPNPMSWQEARADGLIPAGHADSGSAARYFPQFQHSELDDIFRYVPKPSRSERDAGLDHFRHRSGAEMTGSEEGQARLNSPRSGAGRKDGARNSHPTVKGQEFLRYLCRLGTPSRGIVLTPFGGVGSECLAAISEGFRAIGIELNNTDKEPFVEIARARLHHAEGREFIPRESLRAAEPPRQVALFTEVG